MDEILRELDENLIIIKTEKLNDILYIYCEIKKTTIKCKYCEKESDSIHSRYTRTISDLPIQNYQVKLVIDVPKYFCRNEKCSHKTFAYPLHFAAKNALRTRQLDDYIYQIGLKNSSTQARNQVSLSHVSISNNTILRIIKKNESDGQLSCNKYRN
jgi:transposase